MAQATQQTRIIQAARAGSLSSGMFTTRGGAGPVLPVPNNITVNVNGGDPAAIVRAIRAYSLRNKYLPPAVRTVPGIS